MNLAVCPKITKFLQFYNALSSNNMQALADIYHADVVFIDPVHEIHGSAALNKYFANAYARLQHCRFTGLDAAEDPVLGARTVVDIGKDVV